MAPVRDEELVEISGDGGHGEICGRHACALQLGHTGRKDRFWMSRAISSSLSIESSRRSLAKIVSAAAYPSD